jgi:hypothetical protein
VLLDPGHLPLFPRDASGRDVPDRLKPVFAGRAQLLEHVRQLELLKSELVQQGYKGLCSAWFDPGEVRRHLQRAIAAILEQLPFQLCVCGGYDDCEICGNKRWVSAYEYLTALSPMPGQPSSESSSESDPPTSVPHPGSLRVA